MKYGVEMLCPICGKKKGYSISHPQCGRALQKLSQEKKKRTTTAHLTSQKLDYFSKTGGA